ncbi:unnamed protein product, partial [Mesorhabditis belari]|uniref:Leucine-rich repeat-containing protein 58 n=1 Tax=Mesorhabditis belari TaxID=2138241 RepID=A0AAF3EH54_9BILA
MTPKSLFERRVPAEAENMAHEFLDDEELQEEPAPSSSQPMELNLQDLGYLEIPQDLLRKKPGMFDPLRVSVLNLSRNRLLCANEIVIFENLISLDLSNNQLMDVPKDIGKLGKLRVFEARNNMIEDFPDSMSLLTNIEVFNVAGNHLTVFPTVCLEMLKLRQLYLGGNHISELPFGIGTLTQLEVLYLGGNQLIEIPATIGHLKALCNLNLSDNVLESLPSTVAECQELELLSLHNNKIRTLPTGIIKLRNLAQLSLRGNPLVAEFVSNIQLEPPKLKELAGRIVQRKLEKWRLWEILPRELVHYLHSANQCVNPKCKGVYFEACVEHVKFVDFCGKYRVPLLEFLCSPRCSSTAPAYVSSSSDTEDEPDSSQMKMKKVLLG